MGDEAIIEKITGEERIFEGKLVKVDRVDVVLPNGRGAVREAIRHPGASAIVPVDEDGMVTLVRQFRAPVGQVLLEIPAGKLDSKDEDRLLAAKRELREETGLTAENWVHLTDILTTPGFCDEKISIYLATGLSRGETDFDDDEFLNIIRKPLGELVDMAARGELHDSKTLIGILMTHNYLSENREARHGV